VWAVNIQDIQTSHVRRQGDAADINNSQQARRLSGWTRAGAWETPTSPTALVCSADFSPSREVDNFSPENVDAQAVLISLVLIGRGSSLMIDIQRLIRAAKARIDFSKRWPVCEFE
jgi:hypothetical protein